MWGRGEGGVGNSFLYTPVFADTYHFKTNKLLRVTIEFPIFDSAGIPDHVCHQILAEITEFLMTS